MAFQFKDDEGDKLRPSGPPQPILHKPKTSNPFIARIIIAACALVVLVAAGYLMYKGGLFRGKGQEAPAVEQVVPSLAEPAPSTVPDTAGNEAVAEQTPEETPEPVANDPVKTKAPAQAPADKIPPPAQADKQTAPTEQGEPPATAERSTLDPAPQGGGYTIYIGSFPKREIAERVAQKWKKAGYEAFLTQYQQWNRVSLGRYGNRAEATSEAEKLKDSFENGYWVGELP